MNKDYVINSMESILSICSDVQQMIGSRIMSIDPTPDGMRVQIPPRLLLELFEPQHIDLRSHSFNGDKIFPATIQVTNYKVKYHAFVDYTDADMLKAAGVL